MYMVMAIYPRCYPETGTFSLVGGLDAEEYYFEGDYNWRKLFTGPYRNALMLKYMFIICSQYTIRL